MLFTCGPVYPLDMFYMCGPVYPVPVDMFYMLANSNKKPVTVS